MNLFCSVYEKSTIQKGVTYFHAGVYNKNGMLLWWHNICLKQYDLTLPDLEQGDVLVFFGELMNEPKMIFVDIMLKSLKCYYRHGEIHHHEPWITAHGECLLNEPIYSLAVR